MSYRRVGTLLAAVCTLLLVTALPAAAHNELKSSNPKAGAAVDTPPQAVVLTFAEDLIPGKTTVTVTGPDGANAASGEAKLEGPTVTVPITVAVPGTYTVAYKVIADDGDVTDKKFVFTAARGVAPAPPTTTAAPPTTTTSTTTTTTTTAAPPTTQAQNTAASSDSGTTWWPWLVAGLAVILIAVVLLILRRRRGATPDGGES